MIYDKPITNGTDEWLMTMREMEAEAYDDAAQMPPTCPPSPATAETLEALADAARCAFAPLDQDRSADPRPVQGCDDAAVLKGW